VLIQRSLIEKYPKNWNTKCFKGRHNLAAAEAESAGGGIALSKQSERPLKEVAGSCIEEV